MAGTITKKLRKCAGVGKKSIACAAGVGGSAVLKAVYGSGNGKGKAKKIHKKKSTNQDQQVTPTTNGSHTQGGQGNTNPQPGSKITAKEAAKKQFREESAGLEKKIIRDDRRGGTGKIVGVGTKGKKGPTYRPKKDGSYSVGRPGNIKHYRSIPDGGHTVNQR